jgi:hypothetical protein
MGRNAAGCFLEGPGDGRVLEGVWGYAIEVEFDTFGGRQLNCHFSFHLVV